MTDKFDKVPIEEDTRINFRLEGKLGEYGALYESWFWDGISAESLIFVNEDVAELTEEEIKEMVRASPLVLVKDSEFTFNRLESGFTFVNFNFVPGEPIKLPHSEQKAIKLPLNTEPFLLKK